MGFHTLPFRWLSWYPMQHLPNKRTIAVYAVYYKMPAEVLAYIFYDVWQVFPKNLASHALKRAGSFSTLGMVDLDWRILVSVFGQESLVRF